MQYNDKMRRVPHSPDIEILGVACAPAATKEAESHFFGRFTRCGRAAGGKSVKTVKRWGDLRVSQGGLEWGRKEEKRRRGGGDQEKRKKIINQFGLNPL